MDKGALLKRTCWVLVENNKYTVFTSVKDMRAYKKEEFVDQEDDPLGEYTSVSFTGFYIERVDLYERIEEE